MSTKVKDQNKKSVLIDLKGSYLIIRSNPALARLNGQGGECFFAGRTDEVAAMLFEAMKKSEFVRLVVHFANEEYETTCVQRRPDDPDLAIAGPNQLPLALAI
jgi:hypothetical protein